MNGMNLRTSLWWWLFRTCLQRFYPSQSNARPLLLSQQWRAAIEFLVGWTPLNRVTRVSLIFFFFCFVFPFSLPHPFLSPEANKTRFVVRWDKDFNWKLGHLNPLICSAVLFFFFFVFNKMRIVDDNRAWLLERESSVERLRVSTVCACWVMIILFHENLVGLIKAKLKFNLRLA